MSENDEEPPRTSSDTSDLREALGCVMLLVLFVTCIWAPAAAFASLGPWAVLAVAVGAWIVWLYLGPPPFPGQLNGMLAMAVLISSVVWAGWSIVALIRG